MMKRVASGFPKTLEVLLSVILLTEVHVSNRAIKPNAVGLLNHLWEFEALPILLSSESALSGMPDYGKISHTSQTSRNIKTLK